MIPLANPGKGERLFPAGDRMGVLSNSYVRGMGMTTFRITYTDNSMEPVQANRVTDRGDWIDFEDGGGLVLRVVASRVSRIERVAA
jgi:hypothetical protein